MDVLLNAQTPKCEFADRREEFSCKKTTKISHQFFKEHKKDALISCCIWLITLWSKAETFNPCSSSAHVGTAEDRDFSLIQEENVLAIRMLTQDRGILLLIHSSRPVKHLVGYSAPASLLPWNQQRKKKLPSAFKSCCHDKCFQSDKNFCNRCSLPWLQTNLLKMRVDEQLQENHS